MQRMLSTFSGFFLTSLLLISYQAKAADVLTVDQALAKCKKAYPSQLESQKRLACYDSIETPATLAESKDLVISTQPTQNITVPANEAATPGAEAATQNIAVEAPKVQLSYLERKWRLTPGGDWNINDFETYKSNYLLMTSSTAPYDTPVSPTRPNTNNRHLENNDLKFQFSLKSELANNIPFVRNLPYVTSSRLWMAYTQQSNWQVFDGKKSTPLRENDYEPELILSLGVNNVVGDTKYRSIPRMLNLGLVHQSNGSTNPLSRSWNRLYVEAGWEVSDTVTLLLRPWYMLHEDDKDSDNPDIEKYMGYGDLTLRWEDTARKNSASLLLRNNLSDENKGFAQIDLQRRVLESQNLKLHLMLSSGYGASLLDYNHSQTTIGLGLSLGE